MELEIDKLVNKYLEIKQKGNWNANISELERKKTELNQKIAFLTAELNEINQKIIEAKQSIYLEDNYEEKRAIEYEEMEAQIIKHLAGQPGAKEALTGIYRSLKRSDLMNNDGQRTTIKRMIIEKILNSSMLSSF